MNENRLVPFHVAVIMDGNRRWARARGLSIEEGYTAGAEALDRVLRDAQTTGIRELTVFGLSTENIKRPAEEVEAIFQLVCEYATKNQSFLNEYGIKFRLLGNREDLSDELLSAVSNAEKLSVGNDKFFFNLALNYGGRWDITSAAKKLAEEVQAGRLETQEITEAKMHETILASASPDPDLLIRTSGEQRISNFLLWNLAYSEFVFLPIDWPDFDGKALEQVLQEYSTRKRSFGT